MMNLQGCHCAQPDCDMSNYWHILWIFNTLFTCQLPEQTHIVFTSWIHSPTSFEVTGGRVLSFRNVSVGEPAGPDLSGQCGGGKTPPWIRCWKDQPGSLGTEKKAIVFRSRGVMQRSQIGIQSSQL